MTEPWGAMKPARLITTCGVATWAIVTLLLGDPAIVFANAVAEPVVRPADLEGTSFFVTLFGCGAVAVSAGLWLLFRLGRHARARDSFEWPEDDGHR